MVSTATSLAQASPSRGRNIQACPAISDFFLPKIVRSDPNVRKKAVMKERNKSLLKKVIENDSDKEVRQAARNRLQRLST